MATKEEFTKEVTSLPGVGKATAEKLWEAGFKSLADLKDVTTEKLTAAGVTGKAADAVLAGLKDLEGPAPKGAIEVRESGKKAKPKKETVEVVEKPYAPKIKPVLTPEVEAALSVRAARAATEPAFRRYHWWYGTQSLSDAWRSLRGIHNKQKVGMKYRPPVVGIGYGKPALTRGLHSSGFREVIVHNPAELAKLDPKTQAARIGRTVGGKKHAAIEAKAAEMKIRVLNPNAKPTTRGAK